MSTGGRHLRGARVTDTALSMPRRRETRSYAHCTRTTHSCMCTYVGGWRHSSWHASTDASSSRWRWHRASVCSPACHTDCTRRRQLPFALHGPAAVAGLSRARSCSCHCPCPCCPCPWPPEHRGARDWRRRARRLSPQPKRARASSCTQRSSKRRCVATRWHFQQCCDEHRRPTPTWGASDRHGTEHAEAPRDAQLRALHTHHALMYVHVRGWVAPQLVACQHGRKQQSLALAQGQCVLTCLLH